MLYFYTMVLNINVCVENEYEFKLVFADSIATIKLTCGQFSLSN